MKKTISLILALILAILPAFGVAAVSYPSGVTEQNARLSAGRLDTLLEKAVGMTGSGESLSKAVYSMLLTDETLNGIFSALYGAMDEYSSVLPILGIDISSETVSANLADYPQVSAAVAAASSYAELRLDGVKWGVKTKSGFARAISLMLAPFNDALYMLLCSGTINVSVIPVPGSDGYANGIVPLLAALGDETPQSNENFKADATEWKGYMIENLVLELFNILDDILAAPVTELCKRLPNLAYFFKSGGFSDAVDGLLHPISIHIGDIITLLPATKLISILMFFSDTKKYTTDFTENMTTILNDALESSDIELAEIELDELQSCGTEADGKIEANIGEAFVEIMSWLIDTLKLNRNKLFSILSENEIKVDDYKDIINSVLDKPTDDLLALIVNLMTAENGTEFDYQWENLPFTPGTVDYGADTSEYEMQRTVEGIDELISEFIAESGEYKNITEAVKKNIYTDATVAALVTGIYPFLDGEEIGKIISTLGFDFSPAALANLLTERKYSSAASALRRAGKWENVKAENLSFGIKPGDSSAFEDALTAVLRPFSPLLKALLANEAVVILDSVHIGGSNGYNNSIIPILEALGCDAKDIKTYDSYVKSADGDGAIKGIIHPIIKLLNKTAKRPIYNVIEIAPNALNFINNGSLIQCLLNLLQPLLNLLDKVGIDLSSMGLNIDELKEMDLLSMISGGVPGLTDQIKLTQPNLKKLANLGSAEQRTSKATYQGQNYDYAYIVSNKPAVMITALRYVIGLLEMDENSDLIGNLMASDSSDDSSEGGMFDQYASGFGEQMAAKSTDENIAWLYRLFFHERIVEETTVESYSPTIIYQKQSSFKINTTALVTTIFILFIVGMLTLINRKRIAYTISTMNKNRKAKKENTEAK